MKKGGGSHLTLNRAWKKSGKGPQLDGSNAMSHSDVLSKCKIFQYSDRRSLFSVERNYSVYTGNARLIIIALNKQC
jgi:hypothetical protein